MAWQTPKTDWAVNPKNPVPEDFNRIEGNIDFLKGDIETKKGAIVDAINDMNQPAEVTDTHAELAGKIRDISNDATASTSNVLSGKTFYQGGSKKTGTMPNRGAGGTVTPGTANQTKYAGYYSSNITIVGDPDLKATNIKSGVNIFGVSGSLEPKYFASGTKNVGGGYYANPIEVTGLSFLPKVIVIHVVGADLRTNSAIYCAEVSETHFLIINNTENTYWTPVSQKDGYVNFGAFKLDAHYEENKRWYAWG